jgi:hypothetical protein
VPLHGLSANAPPIQNHATELIMSAVPTSIRTVLARAESPLAVIPFAIRPAPNAEDARPKPIELLNTELSIHSSLGAPMSMGGLTVSVLILAAHMLKLSLATLLKGPIVKFLYFNMR